MKIYDFTAREIKKNISYINRYAKQILKDSDPEAVHNFRVFVRRLRSFLQTLGPLYPKVYIKSLQQELKKIANTTSQLRDLEVMLGILQSLTISEQNQAEFQKWMISIETQEGMERNLIKDKLKDPSFLFPLEQLKALLLLPVSEKDNIWVEDFSRSLLSKKKQTWLDRKRKIDRYLEDEIWLHDLRIESKKMRYTIEFYSQFLPLDFQNTGKAAKKMQSTLGDVHDCDFILFRMNHDLTLSDKLKNEVREKILQNRQSYINKLRRKKSTAEIIIPGSDTV